jgi:hypothetical protein
MLYYSTGPWPEVCPFWEGLFWIKRSSLFGLVVSDEENKVYKIDTWWSSGATTVGKYRWGHLLISDLMKVRTTARRR